MNELCELMKSKIAGLVCGALSDDDALNVRRHIDECKGCSEYFNEMLQDEKLLDEYAQSMTDVAERLKADTIERLQNADVKVENVPTKNYLLRWPVGIAAAALIFVGIFAGNQFFRQPVIPDQSVAVVESEIAEEAMIPLPIEIPEAMFAGTPTNIVIDNLEKPLGKPRPIFMVPEGTTNVALGKPIASTDEYPIVGTIDQITDGDAKASDGSWLELGPFEQNITIDLQAKYEIYAMLVWHYHKQGRVYTDVVVQTADDADFITNVNTVFNNDLDNSLGLGTGEDLHYIETAEGKLIEAKGVQAQFVRLHSAGNTENEMNHYVEVAVFGKPVE
jgi:hypothetical protein